MGKFSSFSRNNESFSKSVEASIRRNPGKRLTVPEDVANTIAALAVPEVSWISGSIIFVDGGEDVSG